MSEQQRLIRRLLWIVVGMFGFGFALVPLYDVFCKVTGLNGKTGRAETAQAVIKGIDKRREVTVEFIANVGAGFPWEFKPSVNKLRIHPGEPWQTSFYAKNLSERAMTGRAVPSVAPNHAARFFIKTECFCFTEQILGAHESKEMPVRFIVDRDLPAGIKTLTLSYTFFEAGSSRSETASSGS